MKYGWYETINDAAVCHETPFNVAVIVDQPSSYGNVLREKNNEGKMFDVRLSATAQEHMPRDNTKVNNDSEAIEEKKKENWIVPKCRPIDFFA